MDDFRAPVLHYQRRARSSDPASNGVNVKNQKSKSKNSGNSRSGSVSFSRCSSGKFSKGLNSVCVTPSDEDLNVCEDFTKSATGSAPFRSNFADDSPANPVRCSVPKFRANPSMYEEIFGVTARTASRSRLSDLPVLDPPSYTSDGVFGGASAHKGGVGIRYEEIFGGGLPSGPAHVGASELFGASEIRSFGRHHQSSRRKSLHSFLRTKDETIKQPFDQRAEETGSDIFRSSSHSMNDVEMLIHSESVSEKTSTRIPRRGTMQRNRHEVSAPRAFKDPGDAFVQVLSPATAKECYQETKSTELPKVKLFRRNISRNGLEPNGAVSHQPSDLEYKMQKHSAKIESTIISPESDDAVNFDKHFISSLPTKQNIASGKWDKVFVTENNLKVTRNPARNPSPALTPQSHPDSSSAIDTEAASRLSHGNTEGYSSEQAKSFAKEIKRTSSFKLSYQSDSPLMMASTTQAAAYEVAAEDSAGNNMPNANLHSKAAEKSQTQHAKHSSGHNLPEAEANAELAEVHGQNEDCRNLDASAPSSGETQNSEAATLEHLQKTAPMIGLAETCKEEEREKIQSGKDVSLKKKERESMEKTAKWIDAGRDEWMKESSRNDTKLTEGPLSEWGKQGRNGEMRTSESLEERENKAKEVKDLASARHSRAAVELYRKENGASEAGKPVAARASKSNRLQGLDRRALIDALERREREVREEKENERLKREKELERQREREREREREKDRMEVERATKEAKEKAAAEAQARLERQGAAAMERMPFKVHLRASRERAAVDKIAAEVRARAECAAMERAQSETRRRSAGRKDIPGGGDRAVPESIASDRECSSRNTNSTVEVPYKTNIRASSTPRHRFAASTSTVGRGSTNGEARSTTGVSSSLKNMAHTILNSRARQLYTSDFPEVEGETEERKQARWERHQRTLERAAKALAEKNERDREAQREQAEKERVAGVVDVEIRRWSIGKQGNLRVLLSTLHNVLWRESGWQPVSLNDLVSPAAVKKSYRKAALCVHPDKVQQKGASIQQKYTAEKVFDLLKEAWNKFNLEEQP